MSIFTRTRTASKPTILLAHGILLATTLLLSFVLFGSMMTCIGGVGLLEEVQEFECWRPAWEGLLDVVGALSLSVDNMGCNASDIIRELQLQKQ